MVTMVSLLKRRNDATREEFFEWYEGHCKAATKIPGLRRYVVNTVVDDGQPYDAISELTFDDEAAMHAALESSEGERSRADTRAHVSDRLVLVVEQREIDLS